MSSADRRQHFRFATHTKIEYAKNGQKLAGFAGNLSLHGMFIDDGEQLQPGDRLEFTLFFERKKPITLLGDVISRNAVGARPGAHVEFTAPDALREHIREALLPKIEQAITRAWPSVERMLEFAREQTQDLPAAEELELTPTTWHSTLVLERAANTAA